MAYDIVDYMSQLSILYININVDHHKICYKKVNIICVLININYLSKYILKNIL